MRISDWWSGVCSSDLIEVEPLDRVVDDVVPYRDIFRPLVEIEGDAAVEVEDVVFGDHRAVAGGQIVDRAAILEMRLGVVDAVIGDDDVAVRGRRFIDLVLRPVVRSAEPTSELQSLMRTPYAV